MALRVFLVFFLLRLLLGEGAGSRLNLVEVKMPLLARGLTLEGFWDAMAGMVGV